MKKDSIVFITGSKSSLPFINEAKKRGFKTIVIDNDPECVSKAIADNFALFSAANEELILGYLKSVTNEFEIKGVITYSSLPFALSTVSRISHEFGLPSFNKESVEITYDKGLLHQKMIESGCNLLKTFHELSEGLVSSEDFNFPVFLKSKSGIGSLGTNFIQSKEELKNALTDQDLSTFVIQDFAYGPLLHIDGFIQNGQVAFFRLLEKSILYENSVPLTKSFCKPSEDYLNLEKYELLLNSIIGFINSSKMDNNFFGADFIYDTKKQDFFLIEIGYLMDVKVDRLLFHSGINPYSLLIDISIGKEISLNLEEMNHNLALELIYPIKTGSFVKIESKDIEFEWEKDNLEVKNLPNSVADIVGWGIYDTNIFSNIPDYLMRQIQGKGSFE